MQTPEYQMADVAGREFLAVILRKDTGAAVTPAEYDQYGPMYLPRYGDRPETVARKRAMRARAIQSIKLGLGTAANLADPIDERYGPLETGLQPGQAVDDAAQIPEGAIVRDENGKRFKKQNGKLVPVQ
jgi:hypothetical protein